MFSQSILYIGLAQSMFAAFVLMTKKRVTISDRIMIACLLTFSLKFVMFLLHTQYGEFFDLEISMGLIPLTFGPYLYLYTVYLVDRKPRFSFRDFIHFVPFAVSTLAYYGFFKDRVNFSDHVYFQNDTYLAVRVIYGLVFFTAIVTYIALTFVKLRQYRKGLKEHFSYVSRPLKLIWLNFIPSLFGAVFLTYFITGGINAFSYTKVIDTATLSHIGLTVIAFAVSYFGVRQPSLFRPVFEEREGAVPKTVAQSDIPGETKNKIPEAIAHDIIAPDNKGTKTTENMSSNEARIPENDFPKDENKSGRTGAETFPAEHANGAETKKETKPRFSEKRAEELVTRLNKHMEEEKPYLNSELTLYDLSSQLNLSKNELTDLLNIHIGKNFFSYVNEFRLKAVLKKLDNPDYDHFTIIAIAFDCGFNSKSTFNNLFKQLTGLTPSEYKKSKHAGTQGDISHG